MSAVSYGIVVIFGWLIIYFVDIGLIGFNLMFFRVAQVPEREYPSRQKDLTHHAAWLQRMHFRCFPISLLCV